MNKENYNENIVSPGMDLETQSIRARWQEILELAVKENNISHVSHTTWLKGLYVKKVSEGIVYLSSENNFICGSLRHIISKYGPMLKRALNKTMGKEYEINFLKSDAYSEKAYRTEGRPKIKIHTESTNMLLGDGNILDIGQTLCIDGSEDLSSVIMFGKGGCVYGIQLRKPDLNFFGGKEPYIIEVVAQGPARDYPDCGKLSLWDGMGQRYDLNIFNELKQTYTVLYESEKPQITKIEWVYYSEHQLCR